MVRKVAWFPILTLLVPLTLLAAPTPTEEQGVIKDRKEFIPIRKQAQTPGKIVAMLVGDPQPIIGLEGRGGPLDSLCLSRNGESYRWVYTPTEGQALITQLQVPTGEKGEIKIYPKLNMANLTTTKGWGVTEKYTLVEVEVNDGLGSPAGDSYVATKMKVLDGSKEFPLKSAECVAEMQKKYDAFIKESEKEINAAMEKARLEALKDKKATGPRTTNTVMYVTWLADSQKLRIHFLTKITDGAYETITVGGPGREFPLPPGKDLPPPPIDQDEDNIDMVSYRPAPPRPMQVRIGTEFGVEFGMAYEISKEGKLDKTLKLPLETWKRELPKPPGAGGLPDRNPPRDPKPLPPKPVPPQTIPPQS